MPRSCPLSLPHPWLLRHAPLSWDHFLPLSADSRNANRSIRSTEHPSHLVANRGAEVLHGECLFLFLCARGTVSVNARKEATRVRPRGACESPGKFRSKGKKGANLEEEPHVLWGRLSFRANSCFQREELLASAGKKLLQDMPAVVDFLPLNSRRDPSLTKALRQKSRVLEDRLAASRPLLLSRSSRSCFVLSAMQSCLLRPSVCLPLDLTGHPAAQRCCEPGVVSCLWISSSSKLLCPMVSHMVVRCAREEKHSQDKRERTKHKSRPGTGCTPRTHGHKGSVRTGRCT